MKWIIITLVLIFAGWFSAVKLFNGGSSSTTEIVTTDLSLAKAPMPDSMRLDSVKAGVNDMDTIAKTNLPLPEGAINTKGIQPAQIVSYAKTLLGVPYLYGSTDPAKGFDCSGFITYVFNHFDIAVPRSSIDFTNVGTEVSAAQAQPGDLILFTGTDSTEKFVGHMGIVESNTDSLRFLHSTSGKQYGVTITPLNSYYKKRYVKTVRIFL